jgi:hypothetical protein
MIEDAAMVSRSELSPVAERQSTSAARRVPWRPMMLVRRLHLYLGLFLFPWACLYGVTAFLFNHPAAFADAKHDGFPASDLAGTPLERPIDPETLAREVFELIRLRNPDAGWKLVRGDNAGWSRDFTFATASLRDGRKVSLLFDVWVGGGTIREALKEERSQPAPFASAPVTEEPRRPPPQAVSDPDRLELNDPLPARFKRAAEELLRRKGYEVDAVTVNSVPALEFHVEAEGEVWRASYDPMRGVVTGKVEDGVSSTISLRTFLLRLHLAHGYPNSWGPRWAWALIVDLMAFVMCFWGFSGLAMWWQVKVTRRPGWITVVLGLISAIVLAWAMHAVMTG